MSKETTAQTLCKYMVLRNKDLLWLSKIFNTTITDCKRKIETNTFLIKDLYILIQKGVITINRAEMDSWEDFKTLIK